MSVSERSRAYSEADGESSEAGMLWYECDMLSLVDEITIQQKQSGEILSQSVMSETILYSIVC